MCIFGSYPSSYMKRLIRRPLFWIALLLLGILFVIPYYQRVFSPNVTTANGEPQDFYIATGSDYIAVGEQLLEQKLIQDPQAFHWVAEQMNYPRHVYPGRYILQDGMSTRELVQLLRSGRQEPVQFTFVKFRTPEQLAHYVGEQLEMNARDLLDLLNDREYLSKHGGLKPETAITIFIPNTYELYWNITPKDFFERMYKEYRTFWNDSRNEKRQQWGLNRLEVMTLASIVEEETNKNDEKARIAGVYLNRIRKGWPLEADPTVKFAVGDFTLRRVLYEHLQVDSPYNTYLYPGLPPGPICTPSISSIDAVLNGERHDYMFFVARIDGSGYHHFSETLAQHNAYAREYRQMLNERGIR
ncbi:MAG: endolytic transglycosylase MltG [Bacteroidetes bacterium]|nr:MAG: endolytic transglycosylase MltG [Bacteroidota bacterium]